MCVLDASIFFPNKGMSHFTDGVINFPDQTNATLMPSSHFLRHNAVFRSVFNETASRDARETFLRRDNKAKTITLMTFFM